MLVNIIYTYMCNERIINIRRNDRKKCYLNIKYTAMLKQAEI